MYFVFCILYFDVFNLSGTQLLPFSSSHIYPSTAMMNPTWNGGDVRLHNHNQHRQDLFLGTSQTNTYKEGKQVASFIQTNHHHPTTTLNNTNQHLPEASSLNQTFRRTNPFSDKMFCDSLTSSVHNNNNNTSCALSLLSSPTQQQQTHDHVNGLNQMVNTHSSFMQPLGLSLHDHSLDPVLGSNDESGHCSSIYNMGGSNESHSTQGNNNDAPPLFPFQWD